MKNTTKDSVSMDIKLQLHRDLLKDLSARLPYGVKVKCGVETNPYILEGINPNHNGASEVQLTSTYNGINIDANIDSIKPYLRSMSSMTEDEKSELKSEFGIDIREEDNGRHTEEYGYVIVYHNFNKETWLIPFEAFDWLNAHHFDYRCLIEKGLALEAPKGMYNF